MVLKHYFRLRILLHVVWVVKRCTILHIHLSRSQLREWRAMCERALKENKRIEENFRSTHILHSSIHLAEYYSTRLHLSVSRCSHMKMLIRIWIELNNGFVISSTFILVYPWIIESENYSSWIICKHCYIMPKIWKQNDLRLWKSFVNISRYCSQTYPGPNLIIHIQ